ncbi:probable tRNA N6-adenosine threonylcarbamoyltransferase, mitochondrial isoform X2 [Heterocephalus glaber]|uniref:Probable tRNA N6-adenosine threonylcarbamoyltransferase, mitochondrial isoform X2 n=1 Tax=Heterocephalus glaber TaxID=10181 RepID=A0AAX6SB14_HETGA|nr:probable tRNA N6-adenosine threonylcarbamoyltransferase, mitochondrial isoform X2 [Heterocephalus glaber]
MFIPTHEHSPKRISRTASESDENNGVVSGGVANNFYIQRVLEIVTNATQCTLLCPPPRLCTDNGIMIAWNGIERLRAGLGILHNVEGIRYEPKYVVPFINFVPVTWYKPKAEFCFYNVRFSLTF